jgi:hypothetical protein
MGKISLRNVEVAEDSSSSQNEPVAMRSTLLNRCETLVRSQSVVARRVAGETLIVPIRAKVGDLASIYSFNGSGSLLWERLESPRGVDQLVNDLEREYDVTHEQAEQDVTEFLKDMLAVGLVEKSTAAVLPVAQGGAAEAQATGTLN